MHLTHATLNLFFISTGLRTHSSTRTLVAAACTRICADVATATALCLQGRPEVARGSIGCCSMTRLASAFVAACSLHLAPSLASPPPPPGGGCNATTELRTNTVGAEDITHFPSQTAADCAAACCTLQRQRCFSYTWTSWQPHGTPQCAEHTSCCWLKADVGRTELDVNCTSGRAGECQSVQM
jgi:hypothetical protein